jgi:hypothetical protein
LGNNETFLSCMKCLKKGKAWPAGFARELRTEKARSENIFRFLAVRVKIIIWIVSWNLRLGVSGVFS